MDLPTSPTTPLGPMTRARARAIENEVNSLLVELPFDQLETWLLPQAEMLCVLRYQGTILEEAKVQDGHQEHEEDPAAPERAVLPLASGTTAEALQAVLRPGIRSTAAQPDKSMCSHDPGPVLPPVPAALPL